MLVTRFSGMLSFSFLYNLIRIEHEKLTKENWVPPQGALSDGLVPSLPFLIEETYCGLPEFHHLE